MSLLFNITRNDVLENIQNTIQATFHEYNTHCLHMPLKIWKNRRPEICDSSENECVGSSIENNRITCYGSSLNPL